MQRSIIVLGMGRSGTSLLTNLIHCWGAYANEAELIPANHKNSFGYWEYAPLVAFNNALLRSVSSSVFIPPSNDDNLLLRGLSLHDSYGGLAKRLLASMAVPDRPWVWKDPRLTILLPFWLQFLRTSIFVVAFRHPCEVARSLTSSGSVRPLSASILLWQRSMMQVFEQIPPTTPRLIVNYENLLTQTNSECERLCRFLDRAVGVDSLTGNDAILSRMSGAILENLRHHRQGATDPAASLLSQSQRRLFELLRDLASDVNVDSGDILQCELYPGWREYLLTCRTFATSLRLVDARHRAKLGTAVARRNRRVYDVGIAFR